MSFAPGHQARIPVAIYGATGSVGQRFVCLLADHPWFEVVALCASNARVGRRYGETVNWVQNRPIPADLVDFELQLCKPRSEWPVVFSALDARTAGELERGLAAGGSLVVTNAGTHRMDGDVPLIVPEVNPEHLDLLPGSAGSAGAPGAIVANPNCSTIGLSLALAPLDRALGVKRAHVVTLQAASGAGHPGISSMEMIDNVVPFIPGEEEKLRTELRKILGSVSAGAIRERDLVVSAQCNRVPVLDGHLLCVSVELERAADEARIRDLWSSFSGLPQQISLPSAPDHPTLLLSPPEVPQPRLHRDLEGGVAVVVGVLQPCPVFDWRFVALVHNTVRGAAGGALLTAELAVARGAGPTRS